MCRILGVSRAQYYRYRSPKPSKRRAEDADFNHCSVGAAQDGFPGS
ncbi:hypothetical protein [Lentilactobacillus kefiri]